MNSVTRFAGGTTFNIRVRVVETTLFSPWFYSYTINWRNASGGIAGTLPPNGTFVNGRDLAGVRRHGVRHGRHCLNGPPQAVVANTTVLSPKTGLSFDAPFVQRATW